MKYKSVHDDDVLDDGHIAMINDQFFDGYASLYDLWIANHTHNRDCQPACNICAKKWECILYYLENSKQVANHLNLRYYGIPPYDLLGKYQLTK